MSLEAQAEKILAIAIVHDGEIEIVADDGETGKNTDRPGLERVLAIVRRRAAGEEIPVVRSEPWSGPLYETDGTAC